MLEILGGLLLVVVGFMLILAYVAYRLVRRVVRTARGYAAQFIPAEALRRPALPDPRWDGLSRHLDRRQQGEARLARARIEAFVAERGSAALTAEEAQLMIACERRVPELLDTCLERCATALPGERCDYAVSTLERLDRLGSEAESARAQIRSRDDGRLQTMHRYFDTVAERK